MSYEDLQFDEAESALIADAWRAGVLDWSNESLKEVRAKIRKFYRALTKDECCYCRKKFLDDHPLSVDIEHILPKSKFKNFAITPVNLTVACKRCNMIIKRDRIDFLHGLDVADVMKRFDKSDTYEIVHPNLDKYYSHVGVLSVVIDECTFRRFLVKSDSEKGRRTIEYFDLKGLEVDDLNEIQGIEGKSGSERAMIIRGVLGV